ncbi:MAG: RagB/SusD family nutrient uptake outer membrane protein [Bacteroidetes bacterium]|nr:RagB/SusD family nutrient uptake outer membrane protein [Bacteroidota bacterium]
MKNKIYIIFLSVTLFILNGCNVLDIDPVDSITQDQFWKTTDHVTAASNGLNDGIQNMTLYTSTWGDLRADIFSQTKGNLIVQLTDAMRNTLSPATPFGDWTSIYKVIGQANWIIKNLPSVTVLTDAQRNEFSAEAKFARAFSYFYAVRNWGDVPLVTEPYTSATQDFLQPRTPKADVLASIEIDIEESVANLPVSRGTVANTKGKPTKWAALALKTDFSLWMARVEGKPEYLQKALDAANLLITTGGFTLVATANTVIFFR